jgi:hypothetical protein
MRQERSSYRCIADINETKMQQQISAEYQPFFVPWFFEVACLADLAWLCLDKNEGWSDNKFWLEQTSIPYLVFG